METNHPIVDHQHIDWKRFERLLRDSIEEIPNEPMKIKKFSEGYSNLTYLVSFGEWETVLRRPPFGEIPKKAHDMQREYTILSKINKVYPLAPKPYLYNEDPEIMGRHFYIMEKKQGVAIDDVLPAAYRDSTVAGPTISKSIIQALIELQSIDYKKANLIDIGRPEGYLERQVNSWIKRYQHSKTDEIQGVHELETWFLKHLPATKETTIVHNDFKLNNLLLDHEDPSKVNGVLDWELSTIGDPMTDLGATVAYWNQSGDPDLGINVVTNQPGFFSRREFVELYATESGRDVSHINYYVAFGFYKLGVILQQIYARWAKGEIEDNRFENLNKAVANIFEMANLTRANKIL
ncbi:phosphotransferase family protein [Alkalihalobacillus sp. BA299]|uniref:phosphotransferase family protein n=1 Tax=Alkalihalobacillus sp. BA299 TaxID=2815938 RepID=UPI001ADA4C44|nr:phosphotransferase family protein [Alkalihalobacillus sp. BA299]